MEMPQAAHVRVEGVKIGRGLARGALALDQQHLGLDHADDPLGDLVLDGKDVARSRSNRSAQRWFPLSVSMS